MTRASGSPRTDAVIIGGGLIGCSIAWELARRGRKVLVLDRGREQERATWAAAGMLSPQAEADRDDLFLHFLLHSGSLYPEFVAAIEAATGMPTGYRTEGTLMVAFTGADEVGLRRRLAWQQLAGLRVEWLSAGDALRLEPALAPGVRGGLRFPGDHQVDNRLLSRAVREAAGRAGVRFEEGVEVRRIAARGGRVAGVTLADGREIPAEMVVVAGGAASGALAGLTGPLPIRPVHGELLAVHSEPALIRHVVDTPRVYLVPRADGRLLIGATMEEIGERRRTTAGAANTLLSAALEAVPAIAEAQIVEHWSGHRPATPDGWPLLGPHPDLAGLLIATGHFRNGILMAPATAAAIAALVEGSPPPFDLTPFSPGRFAR